MTILKKCLIFFVIFSPPVCAAEIDNIKTYKLSDADTLTIAQVSLYAYQAGFKITRQRIIGNKITDIPLRMEELDDNFQLKTVDGVSVTALDDPSFDPATGRLAFGNKDGYVAAYGYEYRLINNTFKLLKVTKSEFINCDDKTDQCDAQETIIFSANDKNAPPH